jgi:hypothetical protein
MGVADGVLELTLLVFIDSEPNGMVWTRNTFMFDVTDLDFRNVRAYKTKFQRTCVLIMVIF